MSIRFEMDLSQLTGRIQGMLEGMENTKELTEEIGTHLVSEINLAMDSEESFDGEKWKAGYRDGKALQNTGLLRGAIEFQTTSETVVVGVASTAESRKPWVHNEGMVIKPKNGKALVFKGADGIIRTVAQVTIPKREFIPNLNESPRAKAEIREICEDYIKTIMGLA